MNIPISSIVVGQRRRQDLGDIEGLAQSIQTYGLLHPIVVDDQLTLVAGERRLRACQQLSWSEIEVKKLGELTDAELREIELEENLRRKSLTDYERSRTMVAYVETTAEVLRQEAELLPKFGKNPQGGRPPKSDAEQRLSDRTGIPRQRINDARNHVSAVDRYPNLMPLPQRDALKIAKKLDAMPPEQREHKIEAIQQHDPNVLAELTDRPPLPSGPTPHQSAAQDPGLKWINTTHKIWVVINSIRDHGGFAHLARRWTPESKLAYLDEIRALRARLSEIEQAIEAEIDHDQHVA